jgi:hypothetical protein
MKPFLGAYVNQETYKKIEQFRGQSALDGKTVITRSKVIQDALNHYLTAQGERSTNNK